MTKPTVNQESRKIQLVGGPQLTSIWIAIYFRVLHFGCIFFLLRKILLNVRVDNQKRDFWGPYFWPLDLHQYSFPISSENFAAHSRSQRMPPSNLRHQVPLNHLWIWHKKFHVLFGVVGWQWRYEASGYHCSKRYHWRDTGAGSESQRWWEEGQLPMKPNPNFADDP